ncbi:MAG: hypothetical protein AB4290_00535 [Spirulina sp.]
MDALTVTAIATLVFTKFFETSAEKLAEGTLEKLNQLREKIWSRLQGKSEVEKALKEAENGSPLALEQVAGYLETAMQEDSAFAEEVREDLDAAMQEDPAFAKEVGDRTGDIFNVDKMEGDIVTGGRVIKETQGVVGDISGDSHTFIFGEKRD